MQYQVDQVCAEDDYVDQQEYDDDEYAHVSNDMDDWTLEDWVAFQNGSFAPYLRSNFDKANVIQCTFKPQSFYTGTLFY